MNPIEIVATAILEYVAARRDSKAKSQPIAYPSYPIQDTDTRAAHRTYIPFDPSEGYPAAPDLLYECLRCGVVVPSLPRQTDAATCRCRNIVIDLGASRMVIGTPLHARLFREPR